MDSLLILIELITTKEFLTLFLNNFVSP